MKTKHPLTRVCAAACFIACFCACRNGQNKNEERDTTVTITSSFNNLFLDSSQLENFLLANPSGENYEKQLMDFYRQRNYEYAWFDSSGLGEQANNFMNLLNTTINDLDDSSLYNPKLYELYAKLKNAADAKPHLGDVLQTELSLTTQFFAYSAKVYKGSDIDATQLGWFIPRKKVDLTALLDSVILFKDKEPDEFVALNSQYNKLKGFLPEYFDIQKNNHWDTIAKPPKPLHLGDKSVIIPVVKEKLFVYGDLSINDSSDIFDSSLFYAAKSFQKRMGLGIDGAVGNGMISELNVPVSKRIEQLYINLERIRWMPPEPGSDYIFVNIPEFKMYVYENGKLNFTMNVIVGKVATGTIIFTGNLKFIVFSPYWNVPPSIVQKEIIPGMERDSNYISKHNMEITSTSGGIPVVRQKPGDDNSLGHIKFLFPNSYDIYFHDTPNHDLFSASSRSFSHGCIRLSEPKRLAQFLLRDDSSWNEKRMDTSMHSSKEIWVTLNKTIPVFIGYFTAWVDSDGKLNFRKDIYGHDTKLAEKLFVK